MNKKSGSLFASQSDIQETIDLTARHAKEITILFVTSLRDEAPRNMGDNGLSQLAQYYTEAQVDDIVSVFRSIPVTVLPFFSEKELLSFFATKFDRSKISKFPLVYTTAEGGVGSGRRALIPAVSNLYGVPCCNSGAYGSSIGRHKFHSNLLARMNGVSVPDCWYLMRDGKWSGGIAPRRGAKVILKPTYESASIGISDQSVLQVGPNIDDICLELLKR